ncbi:hypothetical protein DFH11DRAFT_1733499 [Phellopilus nigrolimitatus]|nr:hypothetical protein DFH11DRAFT_1733499 [Phellopilus nigrolimitatus]
MYGRDYPFDELFPTSKFITTLASPSPAEDGSERLARKRPRLADSQSSSQSDLRIAPSTNAVHDEDYYFADGSCIIRVEDTLFHVHRSILSHDSSSFSTLFTLPQGHQKCEGSTDEDPIILTGDTFTPTLGRTILNAFFDAQKDVLKLLNIATTANKYAFKSLETWACDAVLECVSCKQFSFDESNLDRFVQLRTTIRLAQICQHRHLLKRSVGILERSLETSPTCLALALSLADEFVPPIPSLTGSAYFAALLRGPAFWDAPEMRVSESQRQCMLKGYYTLTREWAHLSAHPPESKHGASCGSSDREQCAAIWNLFWLGQVARKDMQELDLADVGGRLRMILKEIDKHNLIFGMTKECKIGIKKSLTERIKAFQTNLVDYFL